MMLSRRENRTQGRDVIVCEEIRGKHAEVWKVNKDRKWQEWRLNMRR